MCTLEGRREFLGVQLGHGRLDRANVLEKARGNLAESGDLEMGTMARASINSTMTKRSAAPQWRPGQDTKWLGGPSHPQRTAGGPGHLPPTIKMHLLTKLGEKEEE